jgi:SAM-dependent methyltransferase
LTAESRVYAEANLDPAKIGAFSFASRKMPEYMHPRLLECKACDLLYASPAATPESLASAYGEAGFDGGETSAYAARTYGRLLARFAHRLRRRDAALDVGAGDGAFLRELLRAGFRNVVGIEPSRAPVACAGPDVKAFLRQEVFRPGAFAAESFDLITCFQTIEHVDDPLALCHDACRALRPGGAFFLIGHNRRALSARLLGRKSPIFDIEHLQLFSPESFRRLLSAAGLGDGIVWRIANRYPLSYWVRLFPLPSALKSALGAVLRVSQAGRLPLALPAGNLAAVAFKGPVPGGTAYAEPSLP